MKIVRLANANDNYTCTVTGAVFNGGLIWPVSPEHSKQVFKGLKVGRFQEVPKEEAVKQLKAMLPKATDVYKSRIELAIRLIQEGSPVEATGEQNSSLKIPYPVEAKDGQKQGSTKGTKTTSQQGK